MSDIDSNAPVYSRSVANPVVVSADTSANIVTNPIFVNLTDGTNGVSVTSNALNVNVTNADLDIRDLSSTQDDVAIGDGTNQLDLVVINSAFGATPTALPIAGKYESAPTTYDDGDAIPFMVDAEGRLQVDIISGGGSNDSVVVDDTAFTPATSSVTAVGFFADDTATDSVDEGDIGAARMTLDRKQLMVIADPTTDSQRLTVSATGNAGVNISEQTLTALAISKDNAANSDTNPIYVQEIGATVIGIEVLDYDTAAAVASDTASNHDYTVSATKTLKVQRCQGSASGETKIEIQAGPIGSLVTQAVLFTNAADLNWSFDFKGLLEIPDTSTGTLRIIRTNRENQAMDLYSTVIGTEVS